MLLVRTTLKNSRIHGIGLFAAEFIPAGSVVWRFSPIVDLRLQRRELARLAKPARAQIRSYAYRDNRTGETILCGDDARFFNHAAKPNVVDDPDDPYQCRASRDINPGDELTCNYYSFDTTARTKLATATNRAGRGRRNERDNRRLSR